MFELIEDNQNCIFEENIISMVKYDFAYTFVFNLKKFYFNKKINDELKEIKYIKISKSSFGTSINYNPFTKKGIDPDYKNDIIVLKEVINKILEILKYYLKNKNIGYYLYDHGYTTLKIGTYEQFINCLIN